MRIIISILILVPCFLFAQNDQTVEGEIFLLGTSSIEINPDFHLVYFTISETYLASEIDRLQKFENLIDSIVPKFSSKDEINNLFNNVYPNITGLSKNSNSNQNLNEPIEYDSYNVSKTIGLVIGESKDYKKFIDEFNKLKEVFNANVSYNLSAVAIKNDSVLNNLELQLFGAAVQNAKNKLDSINLVFKTEAKKNKYSLQRVDELLYRNVYDGSKIPVNYEINLNNFSYRPNYDYKNDKMLFQRSVQVYFVVTN